MTRTERIEREIADMKHQLETTGQKETQSKRSGFSKIIGALILGFILGFFVGYVLLA